MERRGITLAFVCATIVAGPSIVPAGEKIQFSTPSQATGVATPERTLPKSSPSLFDNFRKGGSDALTMPIPQPQNRAPQADKGDKKDWIFGQPESKGSGAEDMFKKKGAEQREPASTGLARYVEGVEKQEAASQLLKRQEKLQDREASIFSTRGGREKTETSFLNPNLSPDSEKFTKENYSLSDYWQETTGMNPDRFAEQAELRRAEFQQIFETRSSGQENTGVNGEIQKQLANPIASTPTDYSSRTSQSSVSDAYQGGYTPLTGGRATVFDDVNARALGRSSSPLNTKVEQPRVQAQPAILQFPARPGELFKRPGSF